MFRAATVGLALLTVFPIWPGPAFGQPSDLIFKDGFNRWIPAQSTTWQWQLTGTLDLTVSAQMYDVDLFETEASSVAALHALGRKAVCYLSAGTWEDWRPDANQFPPEVLGNSYGGWPGERWLDIRRLEVLAPIMAARLDQCRAKGFDGVEPDNVDGFQNDTGFVLTAADQIAYNRWFAEQAHARELSIGLKNDMDQALALVGDFDWALTEECVFFNACAQTMPFTSAGKAVFAAEYTDTGMTLEVLCPQAAAFGLSGILKQRDLGAWRQSCN
jgi:hypothetical protein